MTCYLPYHRTERQRPTIDHLPAPTLLQIVPSLGAGGLARATLDAAQAVIAAGGAAFVASPNGNMVPDLLRLRATYLELPEEAHPAWSRLSMPGRIASILRGTRVDVVQARSPTSAWVAGALARRIGARWIATLHRPFDPHGLTGGFIERRQKRADALVAVSDYVAHDWRRRAPMLGERLETISPGINLDRFDPALVRVERVIRIAKELRVPDGRHVILCPARLNEDQGQKILIEAVKRLNRDDVFCLLLGGTDGPTQFEKELEDAIEDAELFGRVQIGPYVDDMPATYMLSDVVVSTAGARQGFSRALIEAQAMGRPVVAVDGGAAEETMLAGVTGWVAPADDPAALTAALDAALSLSAERRAELARNAQDHVRSHYSLVESNRRMLELYQRLGA